MLKVKHEHLADSDVRPLIIDSIYYTNDCCDPTDVTEQVIYEVLC